MEDLTKTKNHELYHAIRESSVRLFPKPSGRAFMARKVTTKNRRTITKDSLRFLHFPELFGSKNVKREGGG